MSQRKINFRFVICIQIPSQATPETFYFKKNETPYCTQYTIMRDFKTLSSLMQLRTKIFIRLIIYMVLHSKHTLLSEHLLLSTKGKPQVYCQKRILFWYVLSRQYRMFAQQRILCKTIRITKMKIPLQKCRREKCTKIVHGAHSQLITKLQIHL